MTDDAEPIRARVVVLRLGVLAATCVAAALIQRALARAIERQENNPR